MEVFEKVSEIQGDISSIYFNRQKTGFYGCEAPVILHTKICNMRIISVTDVT